MFDDPRHRTRRVLAEPLPVLVNPAVAWPPKRPRWGVDTALWMRTAGLQLRDEVPGLLTEWWVTQAGDWLARVDVTLVIDGEQVSVSLLLTADAVRPRA